VWHEWGSSSDPKVALISYPVAGGVIAGYGGELGDPPVRGRQALLAQPPAETGVADHLPAVVGVGQDVEALSVRAGELAKDLAPEEALTAFLRLLMDYARWAPARTFPGGGQRVCRSRHEGTRCLTGWQWLRRSVHPAPRRGVAAACVAGVKFHVRGRGPELEDLPAGEPQALGSRTADPGLRIKAKGNEPVRQRIARALLHEYGGRRVGGQPRRGGDSGTYHLARGCPQARRTDLGKTRYAKRTDHETRPTHWRTRHKPCSPRRYARRLGAEIEHPA
jgi:hypothetical protein